MLCHAGRPVLTEGEMDKHPQAGKRDARLGAGCRSGGQEGGQGRWLEKPEISHGDWFTPSLWDQPSHQFCHKKLPIEKQAGIQVDSSLLAGSEASGTVCTALLPGFHRGQLVISSVDACIFHCPFCGRQNPERFGNSNSARCYGFSPVRSHCWLGIGDGRDSGQAFPVEDSKPERT